ncbi:Guanine nucleotide exchange protein smcr8a, partial [Frankliniella fusca]
SGAIPGDVRLESGDALRGPALIQVAAALWSGLIGTALAPLTGVRDGFSRGAAVGRGAARSEAVPLKRTRGNVSKSVVIVIIGNENHIMSFPLPLLRILQRAWCGDALSLLSLISATVNDRSPIYLAATLYLIAVLGGGPGT